MPPQRRGASVVVLNAQYAVDDITFKAPAGEETHLSRPFAPVGRQAAETTTQLFAPINYLADPDRELVRNTLWHQIARTMGPLLTDQREERSLL